MISTSCSQNWVCSNFVLPEFGCQIYSVTQMIMLGQLQSWCTSRIWKCFLKNIQSCFFKVYMNIVHWHHKLKTLRKKMEMYHCQKLRLSEPCKVSILQYKSGQSWAYPDALSLLHLLQPSYLRKIYVQFIWKDSYIKLLEAFEVKLLMKK